jgi:hypothetical protein
MAFDRCFVEEPPLAPVASGHTAACFLADSPEAVATDA